MFTLAVRRLGIDDYQPRRLVVVERAAASLSCVRTTHVAGRAITRVSKDARMLWRVKIQWTWSKVRDKIPREPGLG